jgi:flagellar M-ring protein FliF
MLKKRHISPSAFLSGGTTIVIVFVVVYMMSHADGGDMRVIFNELDLAETSQITAKLESLSIPFKIRADGQQILVSVEDVARARMGLAEAGLPAGGSVGYEVFDKSDVFNATSFLQHVNHTRALEGELVRSIVTLNAISRARVHLVLAKNALFKTEQQKPTASVVLKLKAGAKLMNSQIQAIQNLVAGAVPNLLPDSVTIIDDRGTLLTSACDGDSRNGTARSFEELRASQEARLARGLEALLARTVGIDKVRVEVSIEMDFDHFSENVEVFDPEGQVVRSQQTIEDGTHSGEASDKLRGVTVENALPSDRKGSSEASLGNVSKTQKIEEILNYEISKTTRSLIRDAGIIRRISVAVLVDGMYQKGAEGNFVYTPREAEELEQFKTLVKSAIGFREDRGDSVEIVNLRFITEETPDMEKPTVQQQQQQQQQQQEQFFFWQILVIGGAILMVPLCYFLISSFRSPSSYALQEINAAHFVKGEKELEQSRHKELCEKIRGLVDQDPETVAAIVETWLQRGA